MKRRLPALCLAAALFSGCGNSEQKHAFDEAVRLEQQLPPDQLASMKARYEVVIAMAPGNTIARQARARIEAIDAKLSAPSTTAKSAGQAAKGN